MEKQKRIAVINDFSGFGRCSLTVSIPIISAMKIQCCALPTAVLSNHTGYGECFFDDYTDKMKDYYSQWERLGLTFDGIYSGFLGSEKQAEIVLDFMNLFRSKDTVTVIDPVMGDNGRTYSTVTEDICRSFRKLIPTADIITPNVTEACILAGKPYRENLCRPEDISDIADILLEKGCGSVVITGIEHEGCICCFTADRNGKSSIVRTVKQGSGRAGTGDVFASIIAADAVNGIPLDLSVRKAAEFTAKAILISDRRNVPQQEGVCFEEILSELILL